MDFEVNSRLFSSGEWEFMNRRLEDFFDKKNVRGMWPQDYGYPPGLSWNEYLTMIILDPEKFMKQFKLFLDGACKSSNNAEDGILSDEVLNKLRSVEREHCSGSFFVENNRTPGKSGAAEYQDAEKYTNMEDLFKALKKELES